MSHEVLHPKHWKAARGYANGVAATGRMVFTGGLIGWEAGQQVESGDFVGQGGGGFRSIVEGLACAGAGPEHLVRLTWYVTNKQDYLGDLKRLGAVYREVLGANYPAMALVQVVALVEDRAKVEIEATAVIPEGV